MPRAKVWLILWASIACGADFSGPAALEYTRKAVAFGPRPPASQANHQLQSYIVSQLKQRKCEVILDPFTANTPNGPVAMQNILCKFAGRYGRVTVFSGHFDTKIMPGHDFVGANDGGSSTGFLLEFARALDSTPHLNDVYVVFLDGEEAYGPWTETDSVYGSRHLAEKWSSEGMISRIRALINVDMIGDKDLGILDEGNSSQSLRRIVWQTARELGYGRYFLDSGFATEDDHIPFLRLGVPAIDLIDFDYGPNNENWHTDKDTIDKLSAHSFEVVGNVLLHVLPKLER